MRLRIDLAYDGTDFFGWARQPDRRTVQGELERALALVLHLHRWPELLAALRVTVAGRTDTGVHAQHQVCHVDIPDDVLEACVGHMSYDAPTALERRLKHVVPEDIVIHRVTAAPEGFDARFSAKARTYVYRVCDRYAEADPRMRHAVLNLDYELNVDAMNEAAHHIAGLRDFGSFATPNLGGTTIRGVHYASWQRVPQTPLLLQDFVHEEPFITPHMESGLLCFTIVADAFAHNMVRSLVQATLAIGRGRRDVAWFVDKLEHPRREGDTGPASAKGLTLEHVAYPPDNQLASRAQAIKAKRTLPEQA